MTPEEYLSLSERTEKKFPEGALLTDSIANYSLTDMLEYVTGICQSLDHLKKVFIYGRDYRPDFVLHDAGLGSYEHLNLSQQQMETLHAVLGIVTEAGELVELLMPYLLHNQELDVANLSEELGDIKWYEAMLLRLWNLDDGKIRQTNIEKLAARYPEKFTEHHAMNRDLEAERKILEEGV